MFRYIIVYSHYYDQQFNRLMTFENMEWEQDHEFGSEPGDMAEIFDATPLANKNHWVLHNIIPVKQF